MSAGGHAVEGFRATFHTPGLDSIVQRSKAALRSPDLDRVEETVKKLRAQVTTLPTGSLESIVAKRDLAEAEKLQDECHGKCEAAARQVWNEPQSLALLRDDLAAMVTALEAALQEVIAGYGELHARFGWDAPTPLYLAVSSVPFAELNAFLETQLPERVGQFSVAAEAAAKGKDLPMNWDVLSAAWFLRGRSWRDLIS
jgi:hypothetical protein